MEPNQKQPEAAVPVRDKTPEVIIKKRRGAPPGGWPSVKAKRALAATVLGIKTHSEALQATPRGQALYTFTIENDGSGKNLWQATMLTIVGDTVTKRQLLSAGDFKMAAIRKVEWCLRQLFCNDRPVSSFEEQAQTPVP